MAVETAEEGIDILRKQQYDIIIADYKLSGMDGLKFFRNIRSSYPKAKKVLITAFGSEDIARQAAQIGVDDFIEKPFTTQIIEEFLSRLVGGP